MGLRRCIKCRKSKDEVKDFPPNYPNGSRRNECLECCNERTKKWQSENHEKVIRMAKETRRKWFEKNGLLLENIKNSHPELTYKQRLELARTIIRNNKGNKKDRRCIKPTININVFSIKERKPENYKDYYSGVLKLIEKIDPEFDLPFFDVKICFEDDLTVKECFEIMIEKYFENDKVVFSN
jgi:hypothetical protein